ncbi:hypothetical protein GGS21DRAFT_323194 [Xylaria nigripes]|nr:hypothetical protein GGS21DRAFT_323194 [Xylaria nigripes]
MRSLTWQVNERLRRELKRPKRAPSRAEGLGVSGGMKRPSVTSLTPEEMDTKTKYTPPESQDFPKKNASLLLYYEINSAPTGVKGHNLAKLVPDG